MIYVNDFPAHWSRSSTCQSSIGESNSQKEMLKALRECYTMYKYRLNLNGKSSNQSHVHSYVMAPSRSSFKHATPTWKLSEVWSTNQPPNFPQSQPTIQRKSRLTNSQSSRPKWRDIPLFIKVVHSKFKVLLKLWNPQEMERIRRMKEVEEKGSTRAVK